MASAITHFIVGAALALPALEFRTIRAVLPRWAIPVSSGLLAVVPDLDTFAMRALKIPYGSIFGHRGFFHSPFFLILFSVMLAATVARRATGWIRKLDPPAPVLCPAAILTRRATGWMAAMWAGCAITHPLLDALTDGGSGVMLLFPFSEERMFFPWRPIHVSPLDISRFFDRAGYILGSEWPFCLAAIAIGVCGRCTLISLRRSPE